MIKANPIPCDLLSASALVEDALTIPAAKSRVIDHFVQAARLLSAAETASKGQVSSDLSGMVEKWRI